MSIINIICQYCLRDFEMKRLTLSQYWGKTVKIKCKHCRNLNTVTINAELMSGAVKQPYSGDEKDSTKVLGIGSISHYVLAKVRVVRNEFNDQQDFNLQEGDNIIGRSDIGQASTGAHRIAIMTKDTRMSRKHCKITVSKLPDGAYEYVLADLGSTNGTFFMRGESRKHLDSYDKIMLKMDDKIGLGLRSEIIIKPK
ncbi:MAG: FHA domain-containing protein [Chitinophagales bacterium]|nr:FHA domain-containing protein [Chitinophagales bacterium]